MPCCLDTAFLAAIPTAGLLHRAASPLRALLLCPRALLHAVLPSACTFAACTAALHPDRWGQPPLVEHTAFAEWWVPLVQVCADTFIGNDQLRGVSGGQRKRVTTGEPSDSQPSLLIIRLHCVRQVHGMVAALFRMRCDLSADSMCCVVAVLGCKPAIFPHAACI